MSEKKPETVNRSQLPDGLQYENNPEGFIKDIENATKNPLKALTDQIKAAKYVFTNTNNPRMREAASKFKAALFTSSTGIDMWNRA